MRIAGEFRASEWKPLRARLVTGVADAWREAAELLDRRIRGRYLAHARRLLDEPYSGLDDEGALLLDRELAERTPRAAFVVATHEPERLRRHATDQLALA